MPEREEISEGPGSGEADAEGRDLRGGATAVDLEGVDQVFYGLPVTLIGDPRVQHHHALAALGCCSTENTVAPSTPQSCQVCIFPE